MGISFVQFHLYFWKISKFDFDYFLQIKSVACVAISKTLCTYIYIYVHWRADLQSDYQGNTASNYRLISHQVARCKTERLLSDDPSFLET